MIYDKELMLAEDMAVTDSTGPILEIGSLTSSIGPGRGQAIPVHVIGQNLAGSGGPYLVVVEDSNDGTTWTSTAMTVGLGLQGAADGGVVFGLPSNISRYIRAHVTGFTGGTVTIGIIADHLLG